jgi:hypothetical protein
VTTGVGFWIFDVGSWGLISIDLMNKSEAACPKLPKTF